MKRPLSFSGVEKRAARYASALAAMLPAEPVQGAVFEGFINGAAILAGVDETAARKIMGFAYGTVPDRRDLRDMAWQLAAGRLRLRNGKEFHAAFVPVSEPLPVFVRLEDVITQSGAKPLEFRFRIYNGRFAGQIVSLRRDENWFLDVFAPCLKIDTIKKDPPAPRELVGFRSTALLTVDIERRPLLRMFRPTPTMRQFNSKLRKLREEPCHRNMKLPCLTCVVGLCGEMPCHRGTHSDDLVDAACPKCGKVRRTLPEKSRTTCQGCRQEKTKA